MTLASVQSFGLEAPGGGSRILRSLYRDAPEDVLSIATGPVPPTPTDVATELHVSLRPPLGPLTGSRYDHWANTLEIARGSLATGKLHRLFLDHDVTAVHAVAHSPAFWPAMLAARRIDVPFLLTVHDDLRYLLRHTALRDLALGRLARAWREADHRFVISAALGNEYCARYGDAAYEIVTDGLTKADFLPIATSPARGTLRSYFAGLFHIGYKANLRCYLAAMDILAERTGLETAVTFRCGDLPDRPPARTLLTVLGFGSEADVRADLLQSDLLYLPLMLDPEYYDMVAFSLSTKLVTYLASGVPIVYHGPAAGAAYRLLADHDAAILATSSEPQEIARVIIEGHERAGELVANARRLAASEFMLEDQRSRFWGAVPGSSTQRSLAERSRPRTSVTNALT